MSEIIIIITVVIKDLKRLVKLIGLEFFLNYLRKNKFTINIILNSKSSPIHD